MINEYDKTKLSYESNADIFISQWKDTNTINNEKIEKFIGYLKPHSKILDIGAGFGKDVNYLCNRGFDCIGIDFCESFIQKSKEMYDNVFITKKDFLHIDFPDDSFDALWSRGAMFHISKSDFTKVINNLSRIIKDNGVFYLQLIEGENDGMIDRIGDVITPSYYSYYSKQELVKIMLDSGFHLFDEYKYEGWLNHYYSRVK